MDMILKLLYLCNDRVFKTAQGEKDVKMNDHDLNYRKYRAESVGKYFPRSDVPSGTAMIIKRRGCVAHLKASFHLWNTLDLQLSLKAPT